MTVRRHAAVVAALAVVACAAASAGPVAQLPPPARAAATPSSASAPAACPPLLQHTLPRLQDERPQPLCQYAGRVLLVVNTASRCGFTPQFEGLEALHARYAARGLVVMGLPSNDFRQEADDNRAIADLCFNTYGVKFPMFAPSSVLGPQANPLHRALAQAGAQPPAWNFHKILVDRGGQVVGSYPSRVEPGDPALAAAIERALAAR